MVVKKVRIALAIDRDGSWNATAYSGAAREEDNMMNALEPLAGIEPIACYWIEAEVEIPEDQTAQGTVTPAKEPSDG